MAWVMGTTIAARTMISAINSGVSILTSRFIFRPAFYCIDIPAGCEEIRFIVLFEKAELCRFDYLLESAQWRIFSGSGILHYGKITVGLTPHCTKPLRGGLIHIAKTT